MKILIGSNTLNLKQIFWKTKSFFKRLEYCFIVESTKIENASSQYMVSTKGTHPKKRSFAINYFIFVKILF